MSWAVVRAGGLIHEELWSHFPALQEKPWALLSQARNLSRHLRAPAAQSTQQSLGPCFRDMTMVLMAKGVQVAIVANDRIRHMLPKALGSVVRDAQKDGRANQVLRASDPPA